jgi:nitrous oxide reductase accessory protein NosL
MTIQLLPFCHISDKLLPKWITKEPSLKCVMMLILALVLSGSHTTAMDRVEPPADCRQCGMDRVAFAHGRMLIEYADGTSIGTCSIHCTAVDMKMNRKKEISSVKVADYQTEKLIDAKAAIWVVGGDQQGIMTTVPKWAFSKKEDAQKFVKTHGGRITGFDEALDLALGEIK